MNTRSRVWANRSRSRKNSSRSRSARRAQALERQREARTLEVEPEAASVRQASEDLGQPLLRPQAAEYQRRAPGSGGMGLHALVADALHDAQVLAELGEAADEIVEGPRRHQLVAPAEGGDQALPDLALLAEGLDDLEILTESAWGATTFEAHEHEPIMRLSVVRYKDNRRRPAQFCTTTFSPRRRFRVGQSLDSARITVGRPGSNCRK